MMRKIHCNTELLSRISRSFLLLFLLSPHYVTSYALSAKCQPLNSNKISSPGCYFLDKNIKKPILINSNSVVLDLNEKKISDPSPGSQNIGIDISNYSNITIKNGYIDGFWFAISGSGGNNLNILNVNFTSTKYIALNLSGSNITVRGNLINNMDFYQVKNKTDFYLVGLNIRDTSGCKIINNVLSAPHLPVKKLDYRLEYVGLILSSASKNCEIKNNIFSNHQTPLFKSIAIWLASKTTNSTLSDNLILNYHYGIASVQKGYSEKNNLSINVEKLKFNKVSVWPSLFGRR